MSNPKTTKQKTKSSKNNRATSTSRRFEAETLALQSLRLIAAPNPKDDLTDDEIVQAVKRSEHSSELITHLIEFIKTL
jgi:hypothetical protein